MVNLPIFRYCAPSMTVSHFVSIYLSSARPLVGRGIWSNIKEYLVIYLKQEGFVKLRLRRVLWRCRRFLGQVKQPDLKSSQLHSFHTQRLNQAVPRSGVGLKGLLDIIGFSPLSESPGNPLITASSVRIHPSPGIHACKRRSARVPMSVWLEHLSRTRRRDWLQAIGAW